MVLVILDTLDTRSEIAIILPPSEVEKVPGESTHPGRGYGEKSSQVELSVCVTNYGAAIIQPVNSVYQQRGSSLIKPHPRFRINSGSNCNH